MKFERKISAYLLVLVTTLAGWSLAQAEQQHVTTEVAAPINNVYVPGGFDSTSDTYVVVSGLFPNGCYSWSHASKESKDDFNHDITAIAKVTQGMCIQVLIPYQKEVRLGRLATGKHTLKFLTGNGTFIEKHLVVE